MSAEDERIRILEERLEKLERQVAVLLRQRKGAAPRSDARDRYDALDYPER